MRRIGTVSFLALALAATAPGPARAQADRPPFDREPAVLALTADRLTLFESEAEFRRYLRRVQRLAREQRMARAGGAQFAQAEEEPVCATPEECPEVMSDASQGDIVMTGTRASSSTSITNNQKAGVDEGDIVKQIGRFLLVLQDGRLFVVDTGRAQGLALADRVDVYRDPKQDTWYDEMLVHGDRVVVTGYSYDEYATELSVFRLGGDGRLAREGTFYISSNDYYDIDNYATRIAEGRLIVYTPIFLEDHNPDRPVQWPVIRRWLPGEDRAEAKRRGTQLLDARNIYRPVQPTLNPVVHTVSVCPLGEPGAGADLRCRTSGFVGPAEREWYVSPTDAYLWVTPDWQEMDRLEREGVACPTGRAAWRDTVPAMLFRVPLSGRGPGVLAVRGEPINQFSLDSGGGAFRALVTWRDARCEPDWDAPEDPAADPAPDLSYFTASLDRFSAVVREAPERAFTAMPSPRVARIENRFTDRYLVYGGRKDHDSRPPDERDGETAGPARIVAVPVARPERPTLLEVPHDVIRLERAGDDVVLTGYRDGTGLDLSLVALAGAPRVGSTVRLPGRFESEGRSHAFNSLMEADGSGLMGLPTVAGDEETGRYPWNSDASDVSYLSADAAGRLAALGELVSRENRPDGAEDEDAVPGYECEVSCIDWYGNSRPIFTDGRVFGLTGTELIEGRVEGGRIRELRRLDLTAPKPTP